jgi:hypothetical protein
MRYFSNLARNRASVASHVPRSRAMLLVIHSMVSFAILYHSSAIDDLEEKIVINYLM